MIYIYTFTRQILSSLYTRNLYDKYTFKTNGLNLLNVSIVTFPYTLKKIAEDNGAMSTNGCGHRHRWEISFRP